MASAPVSPPSPSAAPPAGRRPEWWFLQTLVFVLAALYVGSLDAPFVFDDLDSIPGNPSIRSLGTALAPPGGGVTVQGRPVLNLSFALNYAFTGLSPFGFRLTNLALHAGAALLLFGIVRRTLTRPALAARYGDAAAPIAAAIALLWAVHPLQTGAVTYVVQRAESLMGFFYLLTLYAFIRSLEETNRRGWTALAIGACVLGMGTKEVMASAPVIVALYDRFFVAASWREVWNRRRGVHLALAATWLLLGALVLSTGWRGGTSTSGFGLGLLDLWATQPRALFTYLQLSLWPAPLIFDYGTWPVAGASDVVPYALVIGALVAATLWAWRRGHPLGFCGLWFFAILAPNALIVGTRQTVAEHRMYLALAPLAIVAVLLLYRGLRKAGLAAALVLAIVFGAVTVDRNNDFRDPLTLWADTVAKKPDNPWARNNLGLALGEAKRHAEALAQYEAALRIQPIDPVSHFNAGHALVSLDRTADAIARFAEAVRLSPTYTDARYNLGLLLLQSNRPAEAARELAEVVRAEPARAEFQANLGLALARSGQHAPAETALRTALRLRPEYPEAAYNLGSLYLQNRRWADAAAQFEATVKAEPTRARAHASLALAHIQLGRIEDAIAALREAARLEPENAETHANLGALYLHLGRTAEATAALNEALRLNPAHPGARESLQRLRSR
ncbi:MAG TPA: tetratricopeptide repeat protein [Opitutaceae bacterium]